MYIVTGGAGFIGSNLVRDLVSDGERVMVVDDLTGRAGVQANLAGCAVSDCLNMRDFISAVCAGRSFGEVAGVFHQGACADTTCMDCRHLWRDNYKYSVQLLLWAAARRIPFVYASSAAVYGASQAYREQPENENPLNPYACSKLLFDRYVRRHCGHVGSTVVGLRYFNVYGPTEAHKGPMASTAYQLWRQLCDGGVAKLFMGTDGYGDGEQRRDFVHVSDVVKVNRYFMAGPPRCGIFNVGTGNSRSFNDLARAIISEHGSGAIEYVPFPEHLHGRYQSFTQADIAGLRQAGYGEEFLPLEDGVANAVLMWRSELPRLL